MVPVHRTKIMKTHCTAALLLQILISIATTMCALAEDLPRGTAQGTAATGGEVPATLTSAAAFIDQKDESKPTVLVISDRKLPTEKWTSEFDLMRAVGKLPFSGVVFFIKDGEAFRTDTYWKGRQASVSGYFKVTLDAKAGQGNHRRRREQRGRRRQGPEGRCDLPRDAEVTRALRGVWWQRNLPWSV